MTSQAPPYFAVSVSFCDHFWDINLSTGNSSKPTVSTWYKLFDQIQGHSAVTWTGHSGVPLRECYPCYLQSSNSHQLLSLAFQAAGSQGHTTATQLHINHTHWTYQTFYNTSCSLSPTSRLLWRACSFLLPLTTQPWLCTAPHCTCVVAKYCNTLPRKAWDMCLINTSMVQVAGEATKPESPQLHF